MRKYPPTGREAKVESAAAEEGDSEDIVIGEEPEGSVEGMEELVEEIEESEDAPSE